MSDKPIIFSAPMVRALLDGRKTQTRRVLRPQPAGISRADRIPGTLQSWSITPESNRCSIDFTSPTYAPGDRLYVREAHAIVGSVDPGWVLYRASGYAEECARHGFDAPPDESEVRWRPSIHMPRWASRITLTVTDVRVQLLQDISEADAEAEGIERLKSGRGFYDPTVSKAAVRFGEWTSTARQGFCRLWNSLHGIGAWDANPWVGALTFTVEKGNIDSRESL